MERRPEPELMDSEAQTQAYAQADFAESNSLFTESVLDAFPGLPNDGRLVDLGCGPADICIRLARRLPGWRITGLDAGRNMLRRAAEAIEASALDDRVTLQYCHLPDPGLGLHQYDAVVSNSLMHHLPDPMVLWNAARQLARPGAPVVVMDLARPESTAAAQTLVDIYAADAPAILREDFYNSLLAAYTLEEIRQQLAAAGLASLRLSTPSDRHWLVQGSMPA